MAMTVQVDVRPTGRIHVVIHTDASYNPDAVDDMVKRAAVLAAETYAKVVAQWADIPDGD